MHCVPMKVLVTHSTLVFMYVMNGQRAMSLGRIRGMSPHEDSSSKGDDRIFLPPPDKFDTPTSKGIKKNCK